MFFVEGFLVIFVDVAFAVGSAHNTTQPYDLVSASLKKISYFCTSCEHLQVTAADGGIGGTAGDTVFGNNDETSLRSLEPFKIIPANPSELY